MSDATHHNREFASTPVTWGDLVKHKGLLVNGAIEQVYRDIDLEMRDAYVTRQEFEDHRSFRRNRNRFYMIFAGFIMSLLWPVICLHMFHDVALTSWTTAISATGDMSVTLWALWKKI